MFRPPYVGIDLDDCIVDGKLTPLAAKVVTQLNAYTEYSPSGKGLHIICKGSLNRGFKKDTIEVYNTGRFFTVTGKLHGKITDIKDDPKSLEDLIKSEFGDISTTRKPDGWVAEKLYQMKPGTIHNDSIAVIGRLHRDGFSASDIEAFMKPHIERVGGDTNALFERIRSIQKYPTPAALLEADESDDFDVFMSSGLDTIDWMVQDIFATETINFIAGLGGVGKSWMLVDLALECAKGGGHWLGRFPVKGAKVLYIEQERSDRIARSRFKHLLAEKQLVSKALKPTLKTQIGTTYRLDLDRSFEAFAKKLRQHKPTLVLIDSYVTLHSSPDNDRTCMQGVLERLKLLRDELHCTFVLLEHEGKGVLNPLNTRDPNANDISGSTAKPNVAESVLTVREHGDKQSMVYHTKNNCGEKQQPFLIKIEDTGLNKTSVKAY
jgi:hypothetical protein